MENKNYLEDLKDIKNLMNHSTKFLSLSGISGILAGVYCLVGAYLANQLIYADVTDFENYNRILITQSTIFKLLAIAVTVVLLSLFTAIYFSNKKAKENNLQLWNATSKRLLINFMIPLATGGFFILFLIEKEILVLVAPLTLLFYGLACVNASKYTLGDIRYLGITMILLGLLSTWFLGYGLVFWALGFGICHIVYGGLMYFKYDRK
ncbi:hypothetical protein [Flavobacterium sp.]|uniref:hypothetical protein n=1 Tax=Flavobacterium sp. TaxID=239 RepID=UPI003D0F5321